MKETRIARISFGGTLWLAALLSCGTAAAQNAHVRGVIVGRSGATMTVKSRDAATVVVVLKQALPRKNSKSRPRSSASSMANSKSRSSKRRCSNSSRPSSSRT